MGEWCGKPSRPAAPPSSAEHQPDYRFCDNRTDYGYKDFCKSPAERRERFAGFFLAVTHTLPPFNKRFRTGLTALMITGYRISLYLSITFIQKKMTKKIIFFANDIVF